MLKLSQGMYVFLKYTKIYSPTCASTLYSIQIPGERKRKHLLSETHKTVVLILNIDMKFTNCEKTVSAINEIIIP